MKKQDYDAYVTKHYKQGYGRGRFENYKSWLTQNSFSSVGYTHIIPGIKVNRDYTLFSDLEKHALRIIEFMDSTIDVTEQVPLIDRDLSSIIAEELGVKHPKVKNKEKVNAVMTTDFIVYQIIDGREDCIAYTVKESEQLENRRVIEKLAIEREYWRRKGLTNYRILTEKDINESLARNIEDIAHFRILEQLPNLENYSPMEREELVIAMNNELRNFEGSPRELSRNFEYQFSLVPGTGIPLIKHLLFQKIVKIDLTTPLNFNSRWEIS